MAFTIRLSKDFFNAPVAVIVHRRNDVAVAVDTYTKKRIADGTNHATVIESALKHASSLGLEYAKVYLKGVFDIEDPIQYYSNVVVEGGVLKTYNGIYAFGNKKPKLDELRNFFLKGIKFVCADGVSGDRLLTNAAAVPGAPLPKIRNCGIIDCEFWDYTYGEIGWGILEEGKIPEDIYIVGNKLYRVNAGCGIDFIDLVGIRVKCNDNLIVNKVEAAQAMAPAFLWDSEIKNNMIFYEPDIPSNLINLEPWKPWDGFTDYCFKNVVVEGNKCRNGDLTTGGGNYDKSLFNVKWVNNVVFEDEDIVAEAGMRPINEKDAKHVVVKGNTIINGILLINSRYATVEDVDVEGNTVIQAIPSPQGGIFWAPFALQAIEDSSLKRVRVHGNTFVKTANQGKALVFYWLKTGLVEDIRFENNALVNPYNLEVYHENVDWSQVYVDLLCKKTGVAVFSGDGTTTQFKVAHGLVKAPSKLLVTPLSADAKDFSYATADDTYIYFNFSAAPPSGTDNVKLAWLAEV